MIMPAYKDKERNTWYSSFKYKDWSGKSRSKTKRGFATKKEAQNWESQFKLRESHELDMRFDEFYKLYLEYCEKRLKINTVRTKDQIFTFHILPFFEEKRINLMGLKQTSIKYLGRNEEPKKSILQQIKRESDKTPEVKSKSRTKDMER